MRIGIMALVAASVYYGCSPAIAQSNSPPDFKEVYELVRTHLAGVSESEVNRAAVEGLLDELKPKVPLLTNGSAAKPASEVLVVRSNVFDDAIAFVRLGRVDDGVAKTVRETYDQLGRTNKLKGLVLDLRYAAGDEYAAAVALADLFLKKQRPLLNWGKGMMRSREKDDAITVPVAVLVNRQTAAAAEAVAAVLRDSGVGLILGSPTAGQATIAQEFPLKNGDRLRIATGAVELGDGTPIPAEGVKPDILVEVPAEEERAYYADAFIVLPKANLLAGAGLSLTNPPAATNRPTRRRFNEAELVRERREGLGRETDAAPPREPENEKPIVYDPALARALDLLKGLAMVRQSRS